MAKTHKHKSDRAKKAWQRESDARYNRLLTEYLRREQNEDANSDIQEVDLVGENSDNDDMPES